VQLGVPEGEFEYVKGKGWRRAAPGCPPGRAPLRPDWDTAKAHVMMCGLRLKYAVPEMRALISPLLDRDVLLIEHTTNDVQWGDGGDGTGFNFLGKLLTQVKMEIAERATFPVDFAFLRRPNSDIVAYDP
jgi:hypothetical protein